MAEEEGWLAKLRGGAAIPRWFWVISISRRLLLAFCTLLSLMAGLGAYAISEMHQLERQTHLLFDHPFTVIDALDRVQSEILAMQREIIDLADETDFGRLMEHREEIELLEATVHASLDVLRQRYLGDPAEIEALAQALERWHPLWQEIIRLRVAGEVAAAQTLSREKGDAQVAQLQRRLAVLNAYSSSRARDAMSEVKHIMGEAHVTVFVLMVLAVLFGLVVAMAIITSIRSPLGHLTHAANRVAAGDLEHQVQVVSRDELGQLGRVFNTMVQAINRQTREIEQKNAENESLLLNILPAPVAQRLKRGEETIADHFDEVTVLFADLVGFTAMSAEKSAPEMVSLLNTLFSAFDDAAEKHGVEKIKTIGDAYMAVSGMGPDDREQPQQMIEMGLDMLRAVAAIDRREGQGLALRVGIHMGPVVAGVIGKKKFIYDLWGDTVNTASRMESTGLPGKIQVTEAVYQRLGDNYAVARRGDVAVKGKGTLTTYLITSDF